MCLINTQLANPTALTAGQIVPIGTVNHKNGCNISNTATSIRVKGSGFYKITAFASFAPTTAGAVTLSINDNGSPIASTEATGEASAFASLSVGAVIYNSCRCNEDIITFDVSVAGTMNEFDVIVEEM